MWHGTRASVRHGVCNGLGWCSSRGLGHGSWSNAQKLGNGGVTSQAGPGVLAAKGARGARAAQVLPRASLEGEGGGNRGSPRAVAERSQGYESRWGRRFLAVGNAVGPAAGVGDAFGVESGPECWGGGGGKGVPPPPLFKRSSGKYSPQELSLLLGAASYLPCKPRHPPPPHPLCGPVLSPVNVMVPIRQTVIKLKEGGLWVHNPVAPTPQLTRMMRRLEEAHGPVKHIVLGTLGVEHKATAGPFSQKFPKAQVWVMPGQYSFPVDLPDAFLGFTGGRPRALPDDPRQTPWGQEIDYLPLYIEFPSDQAGRFGETAFFHAQSQTLIVTDAVVEVPEEPPGILTEDARALMYMARDAIDQEVVNTPATRRRGWRRMAQFALNFRPSAIDVVPVGEAFADLATIPRSMRGLGGAPFGLAPWRWARDDRPSFDALRGGPLVPPILRQLIFKRAPERTLAWAAAVARWRFRRIIPCHLANDVRAGPREFRAAFDFLKGGAARGPLGPAPPAPLLADTAFLDELEESLMAAGTLPPVPSKTEG